MLLNEHKKAYRKSDLGSKLAIHSFETNHKMDFYDLQNLASYCTNYYIRIFLKVGLQVLRMCKKEHMCKATSIFCAPKKELLFFSFQQFLNKSLY